MKEKMTIDLPPEQTFQLVQLSFANRQLSKTRWG